MNGIEHPRRPRRVRRASEVGQILVWCTLMLPVLLVAASLTIDVGTMITTRGELESAVDAATLGGVQAILDTNSSETKVRNGAINVAAKNSVPSLGKTDKKTTPVHLDTNRTNDPRGTIVLGRYDFTTSTFTPAPFPVRFTDVNAVRVNAKLSTAARALPVVFGRLVGLDAFDVTRRATAVIASPSGAKPMAPLAIDKDAFRGKRKSCTGSDEITLVTETNMTWTTFFDGSSSASVLQNLVDNWKTQIPHLMIGDVITMAPGTKPSMMHAMDAQWKKGDIITLAVTDFGNPGGTRSTVVGFAAMQIEDADGDELEGRIVTLKRGHDGEVDSDLETLAECYGLDCRAFLVD